MSDQRSAGSVPPTGDSLVDAAGELGASLARAGALMVSWPFFLLPARERADAIASTTRVFTAVGDLHLSVLRGTLRGLGAAAREFARAADTVEPAAPRKVAVETGPSS